MTFEIVKNKKSLNKNLFYAIMLGAFYLFPSSGNAVGIEDISGERCESCRSKSQNAKPWPSDQEFTYHISERGGAKKDTDLVRQAIREWQDRGIGTNFTESDEIWSDVRIGVHTKGRNFSALGQEAQKIPRASRTMNVKPVTMENTLHLLGHAFTGIVDPNEISDRYNGQVQPPVVAPGVEEDENSDDQSTTVATEAILNPGVTPRIRLKTNESILYALPEGLNGEFRIKTRGGMDTYLTLRDGDDTIIAEDDNSSRKKNAQIKFGLEAEKSYVLELVAKSAGQCSIVFGKKRKKNR